MSPHRSALLLSLTLIPALAPAAVCAGPPLQASRPAPCKIEGLDEEVRCGTYPVWEDRAARSGRQIPLQIVILPATGPNRMADPVFFLAGGPGAGATANAAGPAQSPVRRQRDLVFVDQRGTGGSGTLDCDLYEGSADLAKLAGDQFPIPAVRRCREKLEKRADLRLYTTALAADDLDEVRAWLGYDKVNLHGGSYGTRLAQVYLKRHPASVRTVILEGVAPLDEPIPLHHAWAGQRAVDLLLDDCAADAACRAAFPNLRAEIQEVFARIDRGVTVEVTDPRNGRKVAVRPSRGLVAEGVRFALYADRGGNVPRTLHRAFQSDLAPLVELALTRRLGLDEALATGLMFSVTCAEDLPFISDEAAARETRGTLLGTYRIQQQKEVCKIWPRAEVAPADREPVRSPAPVLLISGDRDPVTPPDFGERVARHLPNSLHAVQAGGGHGVDGDCMTGIVTAFLERGSAQGIDVACTRQAEPVRFAVGDDQAAPRAGEVP
jgi:pimeloyl-ACP methyl ester carboxylesterase